MLMTYRQINDEYGFKFNLKKRIEIQI